MVVRLALLGFPPSVAAAVVEGDAAQDVPALGGEFDVADADVGVAVQVASGLVETGASAVVGGVDARGGWSYGRLLRGAAGELGHVVVDGETAAASGGDVLVRAGGVAGQAQHGVAAGEQAVGGRRSGRAPGRRGGRWESRRRSAGRAGRSPRSRGGAAEGLCQRVYGGALPVSPAVVDYELFLLGGRVFKHSAVTCGAAAVEAAQNVSADLCLLGVTGMHPEAGLTTGDAEEAAMKRALSARAADTYILASSEKIGTASRFRVLPWEKVSGLITDADPHDTVVEQLTALGVVVLAAG